MAQKPDGKPAKSVAVTFTRPAAERIAHVVRTVERSGRDTKGPTWNPRMEGGGGGGVFFHIGTFTGAWAISSVNVVTFKYQTTTPNTASVTNLFWPMPDGPQRDCAIAKEGTAWYLLVPQLYSADAATAATITTASLEFKTLPVVALATSSTVVFSVTVITCSTAS